MKFYCFYCDFTFIENIIIFSYNFKNLCTANELLFKDCKYIRSMFLSFLIKLQLISY